MPRDIGAEMLRQLDEQLAAGKIDQAAYEARKVEVLELIRRGKAVEYSGGDKAVNTGVGTTMLVLGVLTALGSLYFGAWLVTPIGALLAWGGWRISLRGRL